MTPEFWILLGTVAFTAALLAALPWMSRPEFFFAVTVGPEFRHSPEGRRACWRYEAEIAVHTFVALVLTFLSATSGGVGLMIFGMFWLIAGASVAIVRGHRAVMPFRIAAGAKRRADLAPRTRGSAAAIVAAALPLLFFLELALYAHFNWDQLPGRIAVHWGLNGADRWLDKSPRAVYGLIGSMAAISLSLGVVAWGILRNTRRIALSPSGARQEGRFKNIGAWMLLSFAYAMLVPAWLAVRPLEAGTNSAFVINIWGAVTVLTSIVVVGWMAYVGQGGSRAAREAAIEEQGEPSIGDRTPDECWKWGLFYVNPNDPAIFVEKRIGLGWTMNFGSVWGWVVMALMLLPLAFARLLL